MKLTNVTLESDLYTDIVIVQTSSDVHISQNRGLHQILLAREDLSKLIDTLITILEE